MTIFKQTRSFGLVISGIAAIGISNGIWAIAVANIEHTYLVGDGFIGIVLSLSVLLSFSVNLMSGSLLKKLGLTFMLKSGLVFWAMMLFLCQVTNNAYIFALFLILSTAGLGIVDVCVNVLAAMKYKGQPGQLVRFHAIYSFAAGLGAAIGGIVLSQNINWKYLFVSESVLLFLCSFIPLNIAKEPAGHFGWKMFASLKQLKDDRLFGLAAALGFCTIVEGAVSNWSVLYLRTSLGLGIITGAYSFVAGQWLACLSRISTNTLILKFGARRSMITASLIASVGIFLEISSQIGYLSAIGLAISIVAVAGCWPLIMSDAIASCKVPELAVSGVTSGGYAGLVIGPGIIGALAGAFDLRLALVFVVISGIVAALIRFRSHPLTI
jgi:hypothetical protein